MKLGNFLKNLLFLITFLFAIHASAAIAAVSNNGSETVTVYIEKQNRKTVSFTVNPGQKISMPADASKVTIKPRGAIRDDVDVDVVIVANSGESYTVEKYGDTINLLEEEDNINLVQGFITNESNVSVSVSIYNKRGRPDSKRLNPGQAIQVPLGTTKVRVNPDGRDWGDEIIKVQVDLPDGSPAFIESLGGTISFLEFLEEQSTEVPKITA